MQTQIKSNETRLARIASNVNIQIPNLNWICLLLIDWVACNTRTHALQRLTKRTLASNANKTGGTHPPHIRTKALHIKRTKRPTVQRFHLFCFRFNLFLASHSSWCMGARIHIHIVISLSALAFNHSQMKFRLCRLLFMCRSHTNSIRLGATMTQNDNKFRLTVLSS